ncbi:putative carbon monoxide dehydrogenase subunit G [metagenome]|uniref:Putative carbon monoxide dehydrogenase subunit G n=1 Tax=metagenome TaxID=256318 RepID=A0A2P2C4E7_9ZZZZ
MELTHEFTVPASLDETWAAFNDIESVGGCFPGAVVTSVEGDTFQGSCKVKLGPIALVYSGTGTFIEKDESSHTMKIQAKGKDKRGNGTAGADVVATMVDSGDGTTVTVVTDLAITGKPAQFGRGVMQDVSDKLLGQFVECLKTKVGTSVEEAASAAAAEVAAANVEATAEVPTDAPTDAPTVAPTGGPTVARRTGRAVATCRCRATADGRRPRPGGDRDPDPGQELRQADRRRCRCHRDPGDHLEAGQKTLRGRNWTDTRGPQCAVLGTACSQVR